MGGCVIRGCRSRETKNGIKFLRIPNGKSDNQRRKAWLVAVNGRIHKNSRVCEDHFQPDDWEKVREDGTRKLKSTAIPSLKLNLICNRKTILGNITNTNIVNSNSSPPPPSVPTVPTVPSVPSVPSTPTTATVLTNPTAMHDHCYASLSSSAPFFFCSTPIRQVASHLQVPPPTNNDVALHCSPILKIPPVCEASDNNSLEISCAAVNDPSQENSGAALKRLDELNMQSLEDIKARIIAVEKENEKLRAKAASVDKLSKQVFSLRGTLRRERKAKYKLQQTLNLTKKNVSKVLSSDQVNALGRKSSRGLKCTPGALSEGLYFKSQCGVSAYSEISKRFHLPSRRTLSERTQHVKFKSGILIEVFEQLSAVVPTLNDKEKDCHICFDEMAIEPNGNLYDPSTKAGIGHCTLPGHCGTATKAFVVMLCGVSSRWKLVVAYYFSGNRNRSNKINNKNEAATAFWGILAEILTRAEDAGVKVASFSSDMGPENRALWRVLNVCGKRSGKITAFIPHPCDNKRLLHILPDIPHLFKNIVQMLQSNKFLILPADFVKINKLSSNAVYWEHLEHLMEHEAKYELKIAFKLLEERMKTGHFEKMQVGRAMAIFNNRTAAGLTILADQKNKPEYKTTACFISLVVRWFELVASRSIGVALSLANQAVHAQAISHIKVTSSVFQHMIVGKKGDWKPVQEGVLIASSSIVNLQEFFLCERGYKFLLTSRFNQDCLENLFSQIRRRNATPNALLFKNILRGICLSGKTCRPPRGHGYEYDDGEMLINIILNWQDSSSGSFPDGESGAAQNPVYCPPISDTDVYALVDDWELMPLYDMAGAAVHKAMVTHKIGRECPCVQALLWHGPSHHPMAAAVLEKNYKGGALVEVSDECFLALVKCELIFRSLRSSLLKDQGVDVVQEVCKRSLYVWENIDCAPCHRDLATKVMKRYVAMRWKQYGQKGKKDMAEAASIFSSRCHAQKEFVKNITVQK